MLLKDLIKEQKSNSSWTTGKVFICYSYETIRRMRERGEGVGIDGEAFTIEELTEEQLNTKIKSNQWWIEDGDLCIDTYRNW